MSFWDQEGLNAVLSGEWGELDPAWNWSVNVGRVDGDRVTNGAAKIVHFNGNLKPWTYDRRRCVLPCLLRICGSHAMAGLAAIDELA